MPRVQQDWPPEWWQFTQLQRSEMMTASIRVPHTRGQWPPELGGRILPLERGANSKALLQQLRDEAAVPLWPDPEDLATVAASDAQLPEAFSYMPLWLGSSWAARGEFGWWSTRPPHLVLGHVVTLNYHSMFKNYIWKALQHWNWEAEELLDTEGLQRFPSSTPEQRLPRVVALAPHLKPLTETEEDMRLLHVRLAQVAAVAGRKFTWSLPDCNSAWIQGPELNRSDPDQPPMQVPTTIVVPFTEAGGPMQCMWFRPVDPLCLKTGMVYPEFKRMLELLHSNSSSSAAESSTLFLDASSESQYQGSIPVLKMSQAELQRQLAPHQEAHVIYIAADIYITDLDPALQAEVTSWCKYMKDLDEDFEWG